MRAGSLEATSAPLARLAQTWRRARVPRRRAALAGILLGLGAGAALAGALLVAGACALGGLALLLGMSAEDRTLAGEGRMPGAAAAGLGLALASTRVVAGDPAAAAFGAGLFVVGAWLCAGAAPPADVAFGAAARGLPVAQTPTRRPFQKRHALR